MTYPQADACLKPIEARFGMIGRFWNSEIAKVYLNLLVGYEEAHAKQVIAKALSAQREPPSDYDLEVQLNTVKPAPMAPLNRKPQDTKTGKREFEAAFRESHAQLPILKRDEKGHVVRKDGQQYGEPIILGYGPKIPDFWEKRFEHWRKSDATDAEIGREMSRGAIPIDEYMDDDPFADLPAKMPDGKRAEVNAQLEALRAKNLGASGIDMDEWNK